MRVLVIDEAAQEQAKAIRDFAEQEANWYIVEKGGFSFQKPPGDDPRHVAHLNDYRVVFSITRADGKIWRQLSVSVPSDNYPNPAAVFMVADLFGFTGWNGTSDQVPEGWLIKISYAEHCIILAQEKS